ncbi:copper-binding protein [Verticiella sediminum]|uniref:Copper-binding protein n=1 Tax=Verticiella sediminum TaxID=1247510 RepID=A0A556AAZ9_9BURK|nr:copper-binding protein [Verticiella sediminum]TSH90060.1 copper-binding protein [Verticiella sediminum]
MKHSGVKKWAARGAALILATAAAVAAAAPSKPVEGEVRRIDVAAGTITLKHGPIPELELPAITLVYQVRDAGLVADVKPGDKVRFSADRIDGQYTLISITR